MRPKNVLLLTLLTCLATFPLSAQEAPIWELHGPLKISEDKHHFVFADGTPFLLLGDTAWFMGIFSTPQEVDYYMEQRAAVGFTTIAVMLMPETEQGDMPNRAGHFAFENGDISKPITSVGPEDDYWDYFDFILTSAAKRGLYVAMVPGWGTHVRSGRLNEDNAGAYGRWVANRFADHPNLIWWIGGDLDFIDVDGQNRTRVWQELGQGVKEIDAGRHLIGYHPKNRSSDYAHHETWLDFNMVQTSHALQDNANSYLWIQADRNLEPIKPTLDGESRYEDHAINWLNPPDGYFDDFDVRQAAYWSILSGAAGHVYGHGSVFLWYSPTNFPIEKEPWYGWPLGGMSWQEGLYREGALDLGHMRALVDSRPWQELAPTTELVSDAANEPVGKHIQAARGNGWALIYTPFGESLTVNLLAITDSQLQAWWFNPRSGVACGAFGEPTSKPFWTGPSGKQRVFNPPGPVERGNDWVLVLEDTALNFAVPGR